jgi:hypothetical protein
LASTTFGSLRLDGSNRTNRFNGRMAEAAGWTGVNATTFQSDAPTALYTNLTPPKNYSNGTLVIYKRLLGEEGGPDDVGGTFTATDMTYDSGDHPLNYGGRGVGRRASLCHGIERRNYGREGALVA